MTLGADVRSRVNHLTVLHRRWRMLSFGGKCFVFVNFLNICKYSLKVRRGVMLRHLFSRHARSPGPLNKSSSLFLLRGKRLVTPGFWVSHLADVDAVANSTFASLSDR